MTDSAEQQEQVHLDGVIGKIKVAQQVASEDIATAARDRKDIERAFGEVHLNTGSYEGMTDTAMSLRAQQQMLDERQNSWQHATQRLDVLQKLEQTPYFARIDFQEGPTGKPETIYIGLGSFADSPDHFLIYDWRAPISSIYYDGGLGDITYQTPDGPQTVDVKLKRQFQIKDGVIVTMFDTDEVVGDSMLMEALGNASDTKMKSIVTTIQKEQNQIIRDTNSDLLFVQGAAGSGKTAAVLQRVAWLLYRYRGNLTAGQVVLFSPNQLFNDYINQVLPELGEQNMVQMTYLQYTNRRLPKIQVETLQQRFEATTDDQFRAVNTLKGSLNYFNVVTEYANHLEQADMRFRDIKFRDQVFISKEKIAEIYYSFNENYHLANRLSATREELIKILNRRISTEIRDKWVEEAVQNLTREEVDTMFGDQPREFDSQDKEYRFLARQIVMKAFKPVQLAISRSRYLNINAQYAHFLRHVPAMLDLSAQGISEAQWQASVEATLSGYRNHQLSLADTSAYLYLYDMMTGKKGEKAIRFVFIDEVQDYSAFQLAFLKFSFPRAKFTLLGDLNQAIFTQENSRTLLSELSTMFDPEKTRVVQLTKSYRSTQQITDFTKALLVDGEQITAFNRAGNKPIVSVAPTQSAQEQRLLTQLSANDQAHETTAIIGKTLAACEAVADQLKAAGVKATLIRTENQRLVPGTLIVPAYLAKGLEFDAVIVWDASKKVYYDESERQLLYTICSRAMHQLTLLATGELTPLMDRVPAALYTRETVTA
ncbi:DNA helicase [Furfurilactobacillus curtus]|uniref:DNA helicase n=1 Tax=Furfurilactobacillus curtus TaxID=1746200 RepID=A0ABQ5JMI3_9LACO